MLEKSNEHYFTVSSKTDIPNNPTPSADFRFNINLLCFVEEEDSFYKYNGFRYVRISKDEANKLM